VKDTVLLLSIETAPECDSVLKKVGTTAVAFVLLITFAAVPTSV
jgi:hypothetical protein